MRLVWGINYSAFFARAAAAKRENSRRFEESALLARSMGSYMRSSRHLPETAVAAGYSSTSLTMAGRYYLVHSGPSYFTRRRPDQKLSIKQPHGSFTELPIRPAWAGGQMGDFAWVPRPPITMPTVGDVRTNSVACCFHTNGNGTFTTQTRRIAAPNWSNCATWFDTITTQA